MLVNQIGRLADVLGEIVKLTFEVLLAALLSRLLDAVAEPSRAIAPSSIRIATCGKEARRHVRR